MGGIGQYQETNPNDSALPKHTYTKIKCRFKQLHNKIVRTTTERMYENSSDLLICKYISTLTSENEVLLDKRPSLRVSYNNRKLNMTKEEFIVLFI